MISLFQSDVMHLSDDATKLKLFMDVLDGTNAAVRNQHFFRLRCLFFPTLDFLSDMKKPLSLPLSAHDTHVRALPAPRLHDGHPAARAAQTVEKV